MPIFRVTLSYRTRDKKRRSSTRMAEVADFTKLIRPMKRDIRKRFPSAEFVTARIERKTERPRRRKAA